MYSYGSEIIWFSVLLSSRSYFRLFSDIEKHKILVFSDFVIFQRIDGS